MITPSLNAWITCPQPNPEAKLRLFCFPYAGGGTFSFRDWANQLPAWIEVCPLQLPGRERRLFEPPFTRLDELVQALAAALLPYLNKPFACFGHSMGGLIAFELTRFLRRQQAPTPIHLLISGCRAPHLPDPNSPIHTLADLELLAELRRYNGTPAEVLANRELMAVLLPTIRADFELVETYSYKPDRLLDCPITVFGGLQDQIVSQPELEAWQSQTVASFSQHWLPGDHFFLDSSRFVFLQLLSQHCALTSSFKLSNRM